jgi:chemotaxis protein CheD
VSMGKETPRFFLQPCLLFAHREEHLVCTILGSCVAVCLWDSELYRGGMNHFMLPLWNGEGLPTPKYGNVAIEKLLQKLISLGSVRENLVAKVFGGANVLNAGPGLFQVGERNILVARQLLSDHGIRIKASDTGGTRGRRILFNTRSGSVLVSKLGQEFSAQDLPDGRPRESSKTA